MASEQRHGKFMYSYMTNWEVHGSFDMKVDTSWVLVVVYGASHEKYKNISNRILKQWWI
jgi:hypothetical protein